MLLSPDLKDLKYSPTFEIIRSPKGAPQNLSELAMMEWGNFTPLPPVVISFSSDTGGRTKACSISLISLRPVKMPWPSAKSTSKGLTEPSEPGT
jgi:hypothetical protein